MAVGQQTNAGNVNQALTTLAIAWRDLAKQTVEQWQFLNRLGDTGLEAVGFSAGDAATVLTLVDYMNTVAQVYLGTVQSQGSGGTGAILFNFDSALTPLWAGQ